VLGARPPDQRLNVLQPALRGDDLQGDAETPREVRDLLAEAKVGAARAARHDGARFEGACRDGGRAKDKGEGDEEGGGSRRHDTLLPSPSRERPNAARPGALLQLGSLLRHVPEHRVIMRLVHACVAGGVIEVDVLHVATADSEVLEHLSRLDVR
jgi:hypothetical protein